LAYRGRARACDGVCLPRQGWRGARPRLAPVPRGDPEAERKVAARAAAWTPVPAGQGQVLFVDESDLQLLPVLRAMWMQGPRRRIPTPGTNRRHAFFGARDALRGTGISADQERKRAAHFLAFLPRLRARYPKGPLYVALDRAPIHTARLIEHWLADQRPGGPHCGCPRMPLTSTIRWSASGGC
jgi:hypothetical protein